MLIVIKNLILLIIYLLNLILIFFLLNPINIKLKIKILDLIFSNLFYYLNLSIAKYLNPFILSINKGEIMNKSISHLISSIIDLLVINVTE